MRLRCLLGRHSYRYVGFRWVEDGPGCKTGHDHECSRCGKLAYFAASPSSDGAA
jgi:hypothetical protein